MSDDFDFDDGDTVLVRVREHGDSGKLQAKFVANCVGFRDGIMGGCDTVDLDPPWKQVGGLSLRPYEAEFEVIDRETLQ